MARPAISILVLAWNHGTFIRQTLETLVNQEFLGCYEIIIGEDASQDNTLSICKEFQNCFPDKIRVLTSEQNLGMHKNFARLWHEARGNFIAFCEGDDYWSDRRKLAKQIAFFEQHPDCTLCGTFTEKLSMNAQKEWKVVGIVKPPVIQQTYRFEELISAYNFHFSSVMIKKDSVRFPTWFQQVYCVDRPLYLLATEKGKAGLIPEVMSVYRLHQGGNWSAITMEKKAAGSIELFIKMREYFDARFTALFDRTLAGILWYYMSEDLSNQEIAAARKLFWQAMRYMPLKNIIAKPLLHGKVLFRLYFPSIYVCLKESDVN